MTKQVWTADDAVWLAKHGFQPPTEAMRAAAGIVEEARSLFAALGDAIRKVAEGFRRFARRMAEVGKRLARSVTPTSRRAARGRQVPPRILGPGIDTAWRAALYAQFPDLERRS